MTERQCTFPIAPEVYVKMTPAERDAAGTATFEQQQRRDGSGMLRAIEQSGRDRERLQRGEVTREELDQQETDDLARIGLCTDEPWDTMSRDERRKALRKRVAATPSRRARSGMTELSKPKARPTHWQGERRLWFMVQGQTILNMTDADIERLVDETFPDPPGQRPVKHSKRPRAVGKPLKKADGP